jgi:hypothetical protein
MARVLFMKMLFSYSFADQQYLLGHLPAAVSDAELRAVMEKMPPIEADNLLLNADLTALAGHNCEAISP